MSNIPDIIEKSRLAIETGQIDWPTALIRAISIWPLARETYRGRNLNYFIAGEAFDFLSLSERILCDLDDVVSGNEIEDLLFNGIFPVEISLNVFKDLIGISKYRGFLNFYYGITVEYALQLAVELEAIKDYTSRGMHFKNECMDEAFNRIYGTSIEELLESFSIENGITVDGSFDINVSSEFTYWLFKYRFKNCDQAKIASDTRKGLNQLERMYVFPNNRMILPIEEPRFLWDSGT